MTIGVPRVPDGEGGLDEPAAGNPALHARPGRLYHGRMSQTLEFTNRSGIELSARLELPPNGVARAYALLAHCFTCSKDLTALRRIARALTGEGVGVMSFDFTGLGSSSGDFSETGFSSQTSDLIDAAAYMKENYEAPKFLIGHSLGGTACLYATREIDSVRGVATIGSPAAPNHVEKLVADDLERIEREGAAEVSIGGRPFKLRKEFIEDLRNHPPEEWLSDVRAELLILHSPLDKIVGIDNAERIFTSTKHPKSFVSLRGADHLLTRPEDAEYAGTLVGAWIRALMPEPTSAELETNRQVAARIGRDRYTVQMRAGRHTMIADEPAKVGGKDLGAGPYDYLLASLGACTVMTLRMYADRKDWPLESVTVHLSHEKVHAEDGDEAVNRPGDGDGDGSGARSGSGAKIDRIERVLEMTGDLDEDQRNRLTEIADKCPVHRTLTTPTIVDTRLA
jgi:putative redox protein